MGGGIVCEYNQFFAVFLTRYLRSKKLLSRRAVDQLLPMRFGPRNRKWIYDNIPSSVVQFMPLPRYCLLTSEEIVQLVHSPDASCICRLLLGKLANSLNDGSFVPDTMFVGPPRLT